MTKVTDLIKYVTSNWRHMQVLVCGGPIRICGSVDGEIDPNRRFHYAQLGEDVLVGHLFAHYVNVEGPGFYVDVGCYHPHSFSNTKLLYMKGWRGINIDANRDAIELFKRERPGDISIECGVAKEQAVRPYYVFEYAAANTFDPDTRDAWLANGWKQVDQRNLMVAPLSALLKPYLSESQRVDYLNIDIEGLDLEALSTYDFDSYPPALVSVEVHGIDLLHASDNPIVKFMVERGYLFVALSIVTAFFIIGKAPN